MKPKEGDLVRVLNDAGEEIGLALFVRLIKPGDHFETCSRFFEEYRIGSNLWHWEILMNGEIDWLPTDHTSLLCCQQG